MWQEWASNFLVNYQAIFCKYFSLFNLPTIRWAYPRNYSINYRIFAISARKMKSDLNYVDEKPYNKYKLKWKKKKRMKKSIYSIS